jgi:hypothetical protein
MIYTLLSLMPFPFIILYYFLMKKRNSISFEIKAGINCYSCGQPLKSKDEYYEQLINGEKKIEGTYYKNCLSCSRDNNINRLTNEIKYNFISNIKKVVLSEKSVVYSRYLLVLMVIFIFADVIFVINNLNFRIFIILSNLFNVIFWIYMLLKLKYTTVNKN